VFSGPVKRFNDGSMEKLAGDDNAPMVKYTWKPPLIQWSSAGLIPYRSAGGRKFVVYRLSSAFFIVGIDNGE
jgi:hypothetical protein